VSLATGDAPLRGKTVVVTGSTRGIGRAIAEECARRGASVVVSSRTPAAVEETVAAFTGAGWTAAGIPADVSLPEDLASLFAFARETYGGVDVWFNNAGVSPGYVPFDELTAEEMRRVVDVNLLGTMEACRILLPYFAEHGGVLVNVSGRGGRGDATPYTAAYGATKAAVLQFTLSLARENRRHRNVSIHVLLPGMVDTDFYGPEMRVSPALVESARSIRIVLDTIGVPLEDVGRTAADAAAQTPGERTGRVYRAASGMRMMLGGFRLMGYRMTGRMPEEP
jgi:NAD(P)-dependent dehydrogenase (short-subunit alcohol dehydrogenase family)